MAQSVINNPRMGAILKGMDEILPSLYLGEYV
jgi:hypothetical protein